MKNISPVSIWKNGTTKTASILDAIIINDNLSSSCTFYWILKEADQQEQAGQVLADGNVTMSGEDYDNWDGSNDYAFEYIAEQINVVIIS
jgi:hypothetical protein